MAACGHENDREPLLYCYGSEVDVSVISHETRIYLENGFMEERTASIYGGLRRQK